MHTSCSMVHAGTRTLGAAGTRTLGARRYKNTHWCNCPMTQVQEHSDEGTVRQGDQAACVCYNSPPRMRCVWASLTRIWTGWRVVRGRCQGSGLGSRTMCVRRRLGPKVDVCRADCLLCSVHGRSRSQSSQASLEHIPGRIHLASSAGRVRRGLLRQPTIATMRPLLTMAMGCCVHSERKPTMSSCLRTLNS